MKYLSITKDDMNNGPGLRVVLWTSGCAHRCPGCHNRHTWSSSRGSDFNEDAFEMLYNELDKDYISGITYSGGDPLHEANRNGINASVTLINSILPNKTQWLYTGYTYEELIEMNDPVINNILTKIDVLVDGKYDESLRSPNKPWVGSSNQRVIRLKKDSIEIEKID